MPIPVLIQSANRPVPAAQRQTLLDACTAALRNDECVTAADDSPAAPPVASVAWVGTDQQHARVQVRRPDGESVSRGLDFGPNDAPTERFRALGLVVASLYREANPLPAATPPRVTTPPVRHERTALSVAAPTTPAPWLSVALGALGASGFSGGPYRLGPALDLSFFLQQFPLGAALGVTLTAAAGREAGVNVITEDAHAGLAARVVELSTCRVRATAEVLRQRFSATWRGADTSAARTSARTGAQLAAAIECRIVGELRLRGGAQLAWSPSSPELRVGPQVVGRATNLEPGAFVGLSADIF